MFSHVKKYTRTSTKPVSIVISDHHFPRERLRHHEVRPTASPRLPAILASIRITSSSSFPILQTETHSQMSALAIFNTIQAYISPAVTRTIYTGDPPEVTALSARTFGTWTLVSGIVRAYAVYHMGSPDAYALALSTFGAALWHWGGEWLWFGTVEWVSIWPSLLLDVPSAVWMLMSWSAYIR